MVKLWKADMPSGRTCFLQTVWLIFVFCVITDWLIDWFLVFNATFSNISAISWWGVITENTCILIRSHILLSYEPKITPLFFPTQESCSGLYFYIQSTNRRNRGKIDTPKTNIHGRSLSWLHKGTSVKGGYIELIAISYWLIFWLSYSKEKLF